MKINQKKILDWLGKQIAALYERIKNEPVLVRSFLTILIGLGIINLTDAQLNTIDQVVLALVVLGGGYSSRRVVKPLPPSQRKPLVRRRKRKK